MQFWSRFYETTWASYGQVRGSSQESFRQTLRRMRDAHLNRRASWSSRRTFEQAPPQGASSGSAVGRVERRGEASAACPGSATGSISLLWRPWSPVGCAVRGRPSAPPERGMNRRRRWEACERTAEPRSSGDSPGKKRHLDDLHETAPLARGQSRPRDRRRETRAKWKND